MFSFISGPKIGIKFRDSETRPKKSVKVPGQAHLEEMVLFAGSDTVAGTVDINLPSGRALEHMGIKVEMIGQVDLLFDRGNYVRFTSVVRELEAAGQLMRGGSYPFEFSTEKPFETYSGYNVRLRYFIRVTITRNYNNNYTKELDFAVENAQSAAAVLAQSQKAAQNAKVANKTTAPETAVSPFQPVKLEVGIEDCLHIEFEYNKQKYHTKDVILGKINFLLVRIKIKHMEIAIIRREAAGTGTNTYNESESLLKYELMDGAPVKGECIPIRLFLSKLPLTPTYRAVNNIFSVKYYINLVLVDEEDRRYFKQQEVVFWRLAEEKGEVAKPVHLMTANYQMEGNFGTKTEASS